MHNIKVLDQIVTDRFSLYHGDCIEVIKGIPDNSIGLTITSPPFSNLYMYSPSDRDMGNTEDDEQFFENFDFLIPELFRITIPGRLCVIHCKDLPLFMGKNGVAGLRDFPASLSKRFTGDAIEALRVRLEAMQEVQHMLGNDSPDGLSDRIKDLEREICFYQQHNWTLHSKVTIWKCPKTERERTNNSGLLHNQLCKDSSASRQGMADFLLVFRKWSEGMDGLNSAKPVNLLENARFDRYIGLEPPAITPQHDSRQYSIEVWRKYASPCWFDIKQERVLNSKTAKENPDENHLCPLQLDVTDRCVELWTNPDDIVFDPFNGLGTSGWSALGMGRNYIGIELKRSYYQTSKRFLLERAASEQLELGAA